MTTKTSRMKMGDPVTVLSGEYKGQRATIVDPKPFPDSDLERRRKMTLMIGEEIVYLLPRMVEPDQAAPQHQVGNVPTPLPQQLLAEGPPVTVPHPVTGVPVYLPGNITDVDDPRLDPWRPDPAVVRKYVSRNVPNGMTDIEFLTSFWERRENVMLVGDTQSGKTMLVQVLAVLIGQQRPSGKPLPVFTLSGSSGVTDFDLFGQPTAFTTPEGAERLVWLPGVVDLAARAGGILYLDEVNMMAERVTSSLHSLADYRRAFVNRQKAIRTLHQGVEVFMPDIVEGSDDLWIFGTINPGYKGAGALQEAFTNRFAWIPWTYEESVEKKLVKSNAVRALGQALREARAIRSINTPIGTAALERMETNVEAYGVETAIWMLKAMFTPNEQAKVDAIITDRSIEMLLNDEQKAKANANPAFPPPPDLAL